MSAVVNQTASRIEFGPGDDLEMVAESLAAFAGEQLRPRMREFEADRAVAPEVAKAFADLGFAAVDAPETIGGAGLGMFARVLVNRTLAEADAGAALALDRLGPALYALEVLGEDALQSFASPLLDDPKARAVLIIEGPGIVRADGQVKGEVPWVPTNRADLVVGLTPTGAWVAAGGRMEMVRGLGLRAAGGSRLSLNGALLAEAENPDGAWAAFAKVRLYHAALLLGVLYDATRFSRAYAQERVAFGQPIAHHQGLAFLMMDMFSAVERVRLLVEHAARALDAGLEGAGRLAAAAFVDAVEASRLIGPNGVQILGGHGFMVDYPVEKSMREARALGLLGGGVDLARQHAGEALDHFTGFSI